ncbi:MAG: hypothetical protein FJ405_07770, partial [Verrucomicrobia bacterium]|nr:hypothetical protein [Verrucomicrobiota bacterium]
MERQQSRPVIIHPISSLIWSHRRVRLPGWFGGMALILCLWSVLSAHAASRDPLESLVSHLASVSEESLGLDILRGMKSGVAGRRGLPLPTDWSKVESRWGRHKNAEIRLLVQTLGLTFGSTAAAGALREMLIDEKAPAAQRRGALDALTAAKDPQLPPVLRSLLVSPALRAPAIRALAGFDDPETPGALMAAYPGLQTAEKRYVLNTLASRVS